eukprot:scaffold286661_cov26-Tisochrysis_lutea.AAC.12
MVASSHLDDVQRRDLSGTAWRHVPPTDAILGPPRLQIVAPDIKSAQACNKKTRTNSSYA